MVGKFKLNCNKESFLFKPKADFISLDVFSFVLSAVLHIVDGRPLHINQRHSRRVVFRSQKLCANHESDRKCFINCNRLKSQPGAWRLTERFATRFGAIVFASCTVHGPLNEFEGNRIYWCDPSWRVRVMRAWMKITLSIQIWMSSCNDSPFARVCDAKIN